jgi:DNA-binding response OmpR family regulator
MPWDRRSAPAALDGAPTSDGSEAGERETPRSSNGTRRRVLIIDDDEPIRKLLARVASRAGFEADLCRDGGEAIEAVRHMAATAYEVILLDLMMPGVNGFQFLDYLKEHDAGALSRVIVLTASPKIDDQRLSRETIRAVIHKPFDLEDLVAHFK